MAFLAPRPGVLPSRLVGRPLASRRAQGRLVARQKLRATATVDAQPAQAPSLQEKPGTPQPPNNSVASILKGVGLFSRSFWGGSDGGRAWGWTVVTLLLALSTTFYSVLLSFVQRMFWTALSSKDKVKFAKLMRPYAAAVVLGPIILTLYDWAKQRMSLEWRKHMTRIFLSDYMSQMRYYRLLVNEEVASRVDNPDQRISEDIQTFTEKAVKFLCVGVVAVLDFVLFSIILFKIYPPLYYVVLAYAALGTAVTLTFGRRLITLNSQRLSREADFRFSLVRVRENAESIAFYRGEASESGEIRKRFGSLTGTIFHLLGFKRNLEFFTTGYRYVINLLPSLVIAPVYFAGNMQLGVISQAYFAFNHVLNDTGLIVNEFVNLSAFSAGLRRLRVFREALISSGEANSTAPSVVSDETSGTEYALDVRNLSVLTPNSHPLPLAQNVSFTVSPGQRVLVVGESGVGKSSLMRTLCGLWTKGSGSVQRPPKESTLFLPQRPYVTLGSLRENVLYPRPAGSEDIPSDSEIVAALDKVNLPGLVDRVDGLDSITSQLGSMLSLGEQQRLAFARLMLAKPDFVIMDESTSALDIGNEERMYNLVKEMGITCVSVGNRPSLVAYHDVILRLLPGGEWRLESPPPATA